MNKILMVLAVLSMPLMAQNPESQTPPSPPTVENIRVISPLQTAMRARFMQDFDLNKDGRLDPRERGIARKAFEENQAELRKIQVAFKRWIFRVFDTNKDGQFDEQEKAAIKSALMKRFNRAPEQQQTAPKTPSQRNHGMRTHCVPDVQSREPRPNTIGCPCCAPPPPCTCQPAPSCCAPQPPCCAPLPPCCRPKHPCSGARYFRHRHCH